MNVQNMTPKKLTVHSHLTAAQSQLEFPVQGPTVRAAANSAPRPSGLSISNGRNTVLYRLYKHV
jgi:hypothetical protein